MSIFEEVNHVNPIPVVIFKINSISFPTFHMLYFALQIEHKSAAVIKTLSLTLQAIICELQPTTPFYGYFKDVLTTDEP